MRWERVNRRNPFACRMADRHYSRTVIGAPQVGGNARLLILMTPERTALWITSWDKYPKHEWKHAWNCTLFRNESAHLSSDLIREAVAVTRYMWGAVPRDGMITFVDADKTRRKRDPGRCYLRAGFRHVGFTKGGLHTLQVLPDEMPAPEPPIGEIDFRGAA